MFYIEFFDPIFSRFQQKFPDKMSKREPRKRAHDSTNEAAAPGGNDSEPPQQQIMPIINKRYMVEKFIINTVKKVRKSLFFFL